ncbi:angiotensin-converting enzyme-like [Lineus longissimus]|uniref:angiotensin-converting enzyme-like n=1 Tax=Lineus longissimus TaxID=88925 RepID=UPI002B4DD33F
MQQFILLGLLMVFTLVICTPGETDLENVGTNDNLTAALLFLDDYNKRLATYHYNAYVDYYRMTTNITDENSALAAKSDELMRTFQAWATEEAKKFNTANFPADTKRALTIIGRSATHKDPAHRRRVIAIEHALQKTFASTTLELNSTTFVEQSQIKRFLAMVESLPKRRELWGKYATAVGLKLRQNFTELVSLYNEGARENGYNNMVEFWLDSSMEDRQFDAKCWDLWEQLAPAYRQLHAFFRAKLREKFPNEIQENEPIPIHLKNELTASAVPFPEVTNPVVTDEMKRQGYIPVRMFKMAEDFFKSLGMAPMTETFWRNSMIEKPIDRQVQCGGGAFDMWDEKKQDYRIKYCTQVSQGSFKTVHHEMGHVQYYMEYKDQPTVFRRAPNNGFHEAIGDVIGRSFESLPHLQAVGLLNKSAEWTREEQFKTGINSLMTQAIKKLRIVPYILVIDGWRSAIFNGSTQPDEFNQKWWEMRLNYEGLSPPVTRSSSNLDPGIIYHIPAMVPADMRYFVSFIIQFQFQKALCAAAKHTGPLYLCDIYGSRQAGDKLKAAMKLGRSKPWQDVLEQLTGQRNIDPTAILEYFQPLTDWLTEYNRKNNVTVGWDTDYRKYFKEKTSGSKGVANSISTSCIVISLFIVLCQFSAMYRYL